MTKPVARAIYDNAEWGAPREAKLVPYWDHKRDVQRYHWIVGGIELTEYEVYAGARYMVERALESRRFSMVSCYRRAKWHFIPKRRGTRKRIPISRENWES
jgi:hypothetical protein